MALTISAEIRMLIALGTCTTVAEAQAYLLGLRSTRAGTR